MIAFRRCGRSLSVALLAAAAVSTGRPLPAQTVTKTATATMNVAASWSDAQAPSLGKIGVFANTPTAANLAGMSLGGDVSFYGLQFNNNLAGPVTIASGSTLSLSGGGLNLAAANQNVTINPAITLLAPQLWEVNASRTLTLGGIVGGNSFAVRKAGAGTLVLTGVNTFNGPLVLTAGTIEARTSTAALGAGTLALGGGTLRFNHSAALAFSRPTVVYGDTTIVTEKNAAGAGVTYTLGTLALGGRTLAVQGGNVTSGTAGLTFGATTLFGNAALDIAAPAGGGTTLLTVAAITGYANTLTLRGNGDFAQSGVWGGAGSSLALGSSFAGLATLNQANTATGGVAIDTTSAGILRLNNATAAGVGTVAFGAGSNGTLQIQANTTIIGLESASTAAVVENGVAGATTLTVNNPRATTFAGVIRDGGAGTLALTVGASGDGGRLVLGGSGSNTYSGATTVNAAGVLNIRKDTALGSTAAGTTVASGGSLEVEGGIAVGAEALSLSGTGLTLSSYGFNTGALRNVAGANSYGGAITLAAASRINSDAGTLTLSNPAAVSGGFALTLGGAGDGVVSGVIGTGTAGLTKDGPGTWTLGGLNTFTGTATIQNGRLRALAADNLVFNSANALTINGGGTFEYDNGTAPAARAQSLGALTFTAGDGAVQLARTADQNLRLTFSSLAARAAGATGNFVWTGTSGADNGIYLTGQTVGFRNQGLFFNGTNYAWMDTAGGFVRGIDYGTDTSTAVVGAGVEIPAGDANKHVRIDGGITAQNTRTILTLNLAGGHDFSLADAQTLTLTNGGILKAGGGSTTFSGGTALTAASNAEIVIRSDSATDSLTISTPITAAGANVLTKSGAGALTLAAANTFTGNVHVNGGTLGIDANAGLGAVGTTKTVFLNGGTLQLGGSVDFFNGAPATNPRAFTIGTAGGTIDTGVHTATISGVVSSSGGVGIGSLTKTGAGTLVLSGTNTLTSGLFVDQGRVVATVAGALGGTGNTTHLAGGDLELRNNAATTFTGRLDLTAAAATATVNRATAGPGVTHTLSSIATLGTRALAVRPGDLLDDNSPYGLTFSSRPILAGDPTFTIDGNGTGLGTLTFSGGFDVGGLTRTLTFNAGTGTGAAVVGGAFSGTAGTLRLAGDIPAVTVNALTTTGNNLELAGSATYTLQGASTYTGNTILGNAAATAVGTVAGAFGSNNRIVFRAAGGVELRNDTATTFTTGLDTTAAGGTVRVNRATAGAAVTHTLNQVNFLGTNAVAVRPGAGLAADAPYGLTFSGNNVLAGNPTFSIDGNGAGVGTLTLSGGFNMQDTDRTLTFNAGTAGTGAAVIQGAFTGAPGILTLAGNLPSVTVNATSGLSGLKLSGSGTYLLSGASTYLGNTILDNASATVIGTVAGGFGNVSRVAIAASGAGFQLRNDANTTFTTGLDTTANLPGQVTVNRATEAGVATTHTMSGTSFLGTSTLTVQPGGNITAGTAYGLTLSGTTSLLGTPTFNVLDNGAGAGTLTISGAIHGAASSVLTKSGPGTLTLSSTGSTFHGGVDVRQGTLSIAAIANINTNGALGNGTAAITLGSAGGNTGTLRFTGTAAGSSDRVFSLAAGGTGGFRVDNNIALTLSGNLSGTGNLVKAGPGSLVLSGVNPSTLGTFTVAADGGRLQFTRPAALYNSTQANWTKANLTVNSGGTLAFTLGGTGFTTANFTTLLTNLTGDVTTGGFKGGSSIGFDTGGANTTISNVIADTTGTGGGAIGITKLGANILTLSGTNTFTGPVNLNVNQIQINNASALGSGPLNLNGGGLIPGISQLTLSDRPIGWNGNVNFGRDEGASNLNLGAGPITNAGDRTLTINSTSGGVPVAGKIVTMGGVMTNTKGSAQTTTFGTRGGSYYNTFQLGGYALSNVAGAAGDVVNTLRGTMNVNVTGPITNGESAASGLRIEGFVGFPRPNMLIGVFSLLGNNDYTGSTTVANGVLRLAGPAGTLSTTSGISVGGGFFTVDNTGAGNNRDNRIGAAVPVALGGGSVIYRGADQAGVDSAETLGTVTLDRTVGLDSFTVAYGGTSTATVTAAGLARTPGQAALLVNGSALGRDGSSTAAVGRLLLGTAPTLVGGSAPLSTGINPAVQNTGIVPYLVGESSSMSGGVGGSGGVPNTFLTYQASTGLRPLNPADEFTRNAIVPGSNTYLTAATLAAGTAAINSLVVAGGDLTIADGQTLTASSGAVLFTTGNAIQPAGSTGTLDFGAAEALVTVNAYSIARIAAPITGSGGLTKSGNGTLVLAGASSFSGVTTVPRSSVVTVASSGGLGASAAGALDGTVVRAGGELRLEGGIAVGAEHLSLAGTGAAPTFSTTGALRNVGGNNSFAGPVTLTAATRINSDAGSLTLGGGITGTGLGLTLGGARLSGTSVGGGDGLLSGALATGAGTLIKDGPGTWTLAGANTYTGLNTIRNGVLRADASNNLVFGAANALTFGGSGRFEYDNGTAEAARAQSLGALTFTAGDGAVQLARTADQNLRLTFSSLATKAAGATGNFVWTGTSGADNGIHLTGQTVGFRNQGLFFNGTNYAWMDTAGGFVRGIAYGTDTGSATTAGGATLPASSHVRMTGNITAQTTATISTLNIPGGHNLTLAAGQTLTLTGILKSGGGGSTISGGTALSSGAELVIRTDAAGDSLTMTTPFTAAQVLTKSGAGTLTLNPATRPARTAANYVNGGTVLHDGVVGWGSGPVHLNSGTLHLRMDAATTVVTDTTSGLTIPAGQTGTIVLDRKTSGASVRYDFRRNSSMGDGSWLNVVRGENVTGTAQLVWNRSDGVSTNLFVSGTVNFNVGAGAYLGLWAVLNDSGNAWTLNKYGSGEIELTKGGNFAQSTSGPTQINVHEGILRVGPDTGSLSMIPANVAINIHSGGELQLRNGGFNGGGLKPFGSNDRGDDSLIALESGGTLRYFASQASYSPGGILLAQGGTLIVERTSSGSGPTVTYRSLTIGSTTLPTQSALTTTAPSVIFQDGTTLTGDPTFDVGSVNVFLRALSDGGARRTITTLGNSESATPGALVLDSPTGPSQAGTRFVIGSHSTLRAGHAAALGEAPALWVGGTFNPTVSLTVPQLLGGSGGAGANNVQLPASSFASLTIGDSSNLDTLVSGVVSGGGNLFKSGQGTLTLASNNTFTGTTSVSDGTLRLTHALALGNSTLATGGVVFDQSVTGNAFTLGGLSGSTNLALENDASTPAAIALRVGNNGDSTSYSGALSGPGSLEKVGAGTLTLWAANTHAGGTIISGGTLAANAAGSLGPGTPVVGGGGRLAVGDPAALAASAVVWNGGTFQATTDLTVRQLLGGDGTAGSGDLVLPDFAWNSLTIGDSSNLDTVIDGVVSGGGNLIKAGQGVLTLAGANTHSGATTVSAGTLRLANALALESSTLTTGGVVFDHSVADGAFTFGGLSGSGSLALQTDSGTPAPVALTLGGNFESTAHSGAISGLGSLRKVGDGTLTLSGASSFTGGMTISAGTVEALSAGALGSGSVSVAEFSTLEVRTSPSLGTGRIALDEGGTLRVGSGVSLPLAALSSLAGWETLPSAWREDTAKLLYGTVPAEGTILESAWSQGSGGFYSDILTLSGTGPGNTFVLSMTYDPALDFDFEILETINIGRRPGTSGGFNPVGTSFAGVGVPWTSEFLTPGQYGIDTFTNTIWAVSDTNSQFVVFVVPEPATLGLLGLAAAAGLAIRRWRRRRRAG